MAVIGIDLGTTNSLAVAYVNDQVTLIPNEFGEYLTPSVVHWDKEGVTVGKIAKERLVTAPQQTAQLFKRLMGTDQKVSLGKKKFSAMELSSFVVKQLIQDAEAFLGEKVTEAIISVPAYFNDRQRRDTKAIGDILGIKVERVINEPSAAAIACHEEGTYETFIVFDFGGGTLDVSVVDCFENVISICAIAGDNFLGGSDFDKVLVDHFCQAHQLDYEKLDHQSQSSLLLAAERCKLKLQTESSARMSLFYNSETFGMTITREIFAEIAKPILAKMRKVITRAVRDSGFTSEDFDSFILVGGSSQMPLVQQALTDMLNIPIKHFSKMDELVAQGLGTYLAVKERQTSVKDIVVTDICPFSLGIAANSEGVETFFRIIEKNAVLPASASQTFYTSHKGQVSVQIDIYQGESLTPNANLHLGTIYVPVPFNVLKNEAFDITFSYDLNSILYVEVTMHSTGKTKSYQIGEDKHGKLLAHSQHLDQIKQASATLNAEPAYEAVLEKVGRLSQELPYEFQKVLSESRINFIQNYQKSFNSIKTRQRLIHNFSAYLNLLDNWLEGDTLDIFRDEEDQD